MDEQASTESSALWQRSALELAEQIRSGATTSRAVVESHLARMDAVNPHLNAVVRRMDDEALAAADAADASLAAAMEAGTVGPFHGVPFTTKENIDLAGHPTTQGVPALADAIPPSDGPSAGRMRAAGGVPIGRTNLPDFGLRVSTDSTLHGLTRNPWHPNHTAGGSSGGEASAIAAGMSPMGLGNDVGGSLRNPAHCCGIASLKPSSNVIPRANALPPRDPMLAFQLMSVEGPMARTVADLRAMMAVLPGADHRDPNSAPVNLTELGAGEKLRIAVMTSPPGGETHPEISAAIQSAADVLTAAGHEVVEAVPPEYESIPEMWQQLLAREITVMLPTLDGVLGPGATTVLDEFIAAAGPITFESISMLHANRFRLMREWGEFFAEHQIVLSPTWAMPAFEHGADLEPSGDLIEHTLRPITHANVLGLPAAVVPHGMAAGLPVGVQVIGGRFTDLRCLDVAAQIEAANGPMTPIDPAT